MATCVRQLERVLDLGHLEEACGTVMDLRQAQAGMEANDPFYPVYLCEPLVVLNLSPVFARCPETTIQTWIGNAARTSRGGSSLGLILEEALLAVLAQMFGGKRRALSTLGLEKGNFGVLETQGRR